MVVELAGQVELDFVQFRDVRLGGYDCWRGRGEAGGDRPVRGFEAQPLHVFGGSGLEKSTEIPALTFLAAAARAAADELQPVPAVLVICYTREQGPPSP